MHFPQIHGGLSGKGSPSGRGAQPLRHACGVPPPLPRGGLGIAENFSSSPEAPLPGELSSEARLRGCTKESLTDMPMAPPLGELAGVSPTERARMLTANPRRCDSIALTKSLPIAAQRLFPAGLALSVIASQCHLSQRERLWQAASFPVSFWQKEWYNGFAALPAHFIREGGEAQWSLFLPLSCPSQRM